MRIRAYILTGILIALPFCVKADGEGRLYQYVRKDTVGRGEARLVSYLPGLSHYVPHVMRCYGRARSAHEHLWKIPTSLQPTLLFLSDMQDDGNGGASPLPSNFINVGMSPVNMSYCVMPTTERYSHLFEHEYTHIVLSDRPNKRDLRWRKVFGTKVVADNRFPLSMAWSYLTTPRWYVPRWYHEGMACFMETSMSGGIGRALGGYDEMYFRTMVQEGESFSSLVGLETEGTTRDFQMGANAYLYGTRFVNYIMMRYGWDKVAAFYNRTDSSKVFFSKQYKKVFGTLLGEDWKLWQEYERLHQQRNLELIKRYPITETEKISDKAFGSASSLVIDDSLHMAYTAVNYPGDVAHIERIDLCTRERKRLYNIDGPMLYQTAYLAFDRKRQRIIWTDRNAAMRGLRWRSVGGRSGVGDAVSRAGHLKYQRVSNIVYDNARDCLYGLLTNEGIVHIVRYDAALQQRTVLYTFNFGVSVSDLDVSHNGEMLSMTVIGTGGEHKLIIFNVDDLDNANYTYRTVCQLKDSNLSQFRFAKDDQSLVGTSYYTGVANLWRVDLKDSSMHLLSNVSDGLFAPTVTASDTLYAMQYCRNGFIPVRLKAKEITDCNAIEYLGQKVYDLHPEVAEIQKTMRDTSHISFSEVYDSLKAYIPLKEMVFQGAYPNVSGFTDAEGWNNVTPVVEYCLTFSDPIEMSKLNVAIGMSPWSHNPWKNRLHAAIDWRVGNLGFSAAWNKTDFYDLFGPTIRSRKGYDVGIEYGRQYTMQLPYQWYWNLSLNTYGDMDALPLYQNVSVGQSIKSFQTFGADIGASMVRTSLGGVMREQGYSWNVNAYSYLADGQFFPSVTASLAEGTLLPVMRNTSAWVYLSVGQHWGNRSAVFGKEYFGGFRNNRIDHGSVSRYREVNAMPGVNIDAIDTRSFCKLMGEVNFMPLRFHNAGLLFLYPTYTQLSLFATDLMADPWGSDAFRNHVSIGAQLNTEIVLFNYLNATLSLGYARCFNQNVSGMKRSTGEWLVTLKLL